jgi:hypothetical protein
VRRDVDRLTDGEHDPDEAMAFLARQLDEPVVVTDESVEAILAGDADQAARAVVGPRVVRAGVAASVAASVGGRLAAAVAAVIEERVGGPAGVSGEQDRGAEDVPHDEVVGRR